MILTRFCQNVEQSVCESPAGTIPEDLDNSVFGGPERGEGIVGIFPEALTEGMVL